MACRRCGEDEIGGEHVVMWCEKIVRPVFIFGKEVAEREWTWWEEVEECMGNMARTER